MLVELIFHHVWKKISKFMVFTFIENAVNPGIFTHDPAPHSKFQAEFFENLFLLTVKMGGVNYDLLSIRECEYDLEH